MTMLMAGMGEKPITRSGPYFWRCRRWRWQSAGSLLPRCCAKAAQAALLLPSLRAVVFSAMLAQASTGFGHRQCGAPVRQQLAAHHRVFLRGWRCTDTSCSWPHGATARLVVRGQVGTGAGVVGLWVSPGDDAALDVDFPAARAGAVHAVGGAHDLVVRPAVAVASSQVRSSPVVTPWPSEPFSLGLESGSVGREKVTHVNSLGKCGVVGPGGQGRGGQGS